MTQRDLKRLADMMKDRRGEMLLSQEEFAKRGSMGLKTVQRIEAALIEPRVQTLGKIDKAAGWKAGSARRILEGGRPTPLDAPPVRIPPMDELVNKPVSEALKVRERVREINGDKAAATWWADYKDYLDRQSQGESEYRS